MLTTRTLLALIVLGALVASEPTSAQVSRHHAGRHVNANAHYRFGRVIRVPRSHDVVSTRRVQCVWLKGCFPVENVVRR
jgi:hypothetical protein